MNQLLHPRHHDAAGGAREAHPAMSDPWTPPYADTPDTSDGAEPTASPPWAFDLPRPEAAPTPCALPPRLFTPGAIAIAALLGSTAAGTLLHAWNLRALGRTRGAALWAVGGVVVTEVLFGGSSILPDTASQVMMFALLVFALRAVATNAFRGSLYAAELVSVKPLSRWWCVAVAVAYPVTVLVCGLAWDSATKR